MAPGNLVPMSTDVIAARARRANGIPAAPSGEPRHWAERLLRSPWTWTLLGATAIYAGCLVWMYLTITADVEVPGGTLPGINWSAIRRSAGLAWPTLAVWILVFLALDRFRPARPSLWYLALGWGAAVSTALSMLINTWAAEHLAIEGNGDPASGARAAVFVAPFVEEATKATVLFFIAMALRHRMVTKMQAVALAGLSAAGFAFTENILYFSRVIVYSSMNIEAGNPEDALSSIVFLRGVLTAFGHPLFTTFTAIGLIIAVRTRSKVVRVIAPLVGYLIAALLHMVFNFFASAGMDPLWMALSGWIVTISVAVHLLRGLLVEGRRHRERLGDYVVMGWLPESDIRAFSRQWTRWRSLVVAISRGRRVVLDTARLQRTMSELVYLRDAQVRGTADFGARPRERELLDAAHLLRLTAITDPREQKFRWPKLPSVRRLLRWRRPDASSSVDPRWGPPDAAPQQGVPTSVGVGHSPVDPRWAPPPG